MRQLWNEIRLASRFIAYLMKHPRSRFRKWEAVASELPNYIRNRKRWAMAESLQWKGTPLVAYLAGGEKYMLGADPLDSRIIQETFGYNSRLYFPPSADKLIENGLVLDVGAHHGVYTVAAAVRYPRSNVIAIEPDVDSVNLLQRNIELNSLADRVNIVPMAVSKAIGSSQLLRDPAGSWGNRLVQSEELGVTITVKTDTLNNILKGREPRIVKCNCEGGEFAAIPQLFGLGIRPPILILLVHADAGDVDHLRSLTESKGYRIQEFSIDPAKPRWLCELH